MKITKKIFSLILSTAIALTFIVALPTSAFAISPAVNEDAADLKFSSVSVTQQQITAGDTFTVAFNISNSGGEQALDVYVTPQYNVGSFVPFNSNSQTAFVGYIDGRVKRPNSQLYTQGSASGSIQVKAEKELTTGTHALTIDLAGKTLDGDTITDSAVVYVNIYNPNDNQSQSDIEINNLTLNAKVDDKITAGEEFSLSFDLNNKGDNEAVDVKLTSSYSTDTFLPTTLDTIERIDDIRANSKVRHTMKFKASKDMPTGYQLLEINVTYSNEKSSEDVEKTYTYQTFVYIENPKDSGGEEGLSSTPRVILEDYSLDVENIMSGEPFTFTFTLKNTNKTLDVANMKVTVNSSDFTPVEGGNSFYTESLPTGATETYTIKLTTKATTSTASYPITIDLQYEDENLVSYPKPGDDISETLNLSVTQPVKFEIKDFDAPMESYGLMPVNVSFKYFNGGRAGLNNVTATVEGDFMNSYGAEYVGALGAGSFYETSFSLSPNGTGEQTGIIVVTFEDDTGKEQRAEHEFTVNIIEDTYNPEGDGFDPNFGKIYVGIDKETGMELWANEFFDADNNVIYGVDCGFDEEKMEAILKAYDLPDDKGNAVYLGMVKFDDNFFPYIEGGSALMPILLISIGGALVVAILVVILVKVGKKKKANAIDDEDDED